VKTNIDNIKRQIFSCEMRILIKIQFNLNIVRNPINVSLSHFLSLSLSLALSLSLSLAQMDCLIN
jgi:hypothetical protein